MSKSSKDALTNFEAYKVAIATRNFEIDLYWKRSLFFWGFIATAALKVMVRVCNLNLKNRTLTLLC
ncbi:RipA family octameric membrane protein [Vibrio splendidus]|uniref:RipA family octameric membrane protein n=1 Tax=Vibrio splendidus TaxID=29497 RepID=UPI004038B2D2